MSLFTSRVVCEDVKFYSHHIDPVEANINGVLTIANGHSTLPQVPDQLYSLIVPSTGDVSANGHLQIIGQAGTPSPAVLALDIAPSGVVDFPNGITVNGQPVGGSSSAHKQYVASVATPPYPQYNATTMYTFDLTGISANNFVVYLNNIAGTVASAGSGCAYDFYLSDTLNGAYDSTKGCLKYNTGVITNGNSFNSGVQTMLFSSASNPASLYLNVIQTNPTQQSGTIANLTFTADVVASTVVQA